jgi:hypothetical protein
MHSKEDYDSTTTPGKKNSDKKGKQLQQQAEEFDG